MLLLWLWLWLWLWWWWLWWWWFGPECKCRISVDNASHNAPNYGGRVPVDTTPGPAPVCRALKTHPVTPRTAPSGVKLPPSHDMATQEPAQHIGVAESVQSADAEHVDTTAAVASKVLPVKPWTRTSSYTSHSRLELPKACSYPCHAQKAGTTHRWCVTRCQVG